ncbi:hypothetical protein BC833DRAFT_599362 [Globomyces pollinis-pini]|nr:hypothetical protein BC833DRAFT_599362 [Globomyces pollinis-pini]
MNPILKVRGIVHRRYFEDIKRTVDPRNDDRSQNNDNQFHNEHPDDAHYNDGQQDDPYYNNGQPNNYPNGSDNQQNYDDYGDNRYQENDRDYRDYDDRYPDDRQLYSAPNSGLYSGNSGTHPPRQPYYDDGPDDFFVDNIDPYRQSFNPARDRDRNNHQQHEDPYFSPNARGNYDERPQRSASPGLRTRSPAPQIPQKSHPIRTKSPKPLDFAQTPREVLPSPPVDKKVADLTDRMKPLQVKTDYGQKVAIDNATVQYCEQKPDGKWQFTVHAKYNNGRLNILQRSYDDFWALHVTLVTRFPKESGRGGEPRSIPFLTIPTGGQNLQQAEMARFDLNRYLSELLTVPGHILQSTYVNKFFEVRAGDTKSFASAPVDVADTLMDLLEDYQEDSTITIKLCLGEEIIAWKEQRAITYDELCMTAEDRLGFNFSELLYMDECESMIPLYGDSDLKLLMSLKKLKFYVK